LHGGLLVGGVRFYVVTVKPRFYAVTPKSRLESAIHQHADF